MARRKKAGIEQLVLAELMGLQLLDVIVHSKQFAIMSARITQALFECQWCHHQHWGYRKDLCGW